MRSCYKFSEIILIIYLYLRTNVQIASKIHDEILSNVPGAIVETSIGADGKRIS